MIDLKSRQDFWRLPSLGKITILDCCNIFAQAKHMEMNKYRNQFTGIFLKDASNHFRCLKGQLGMEMIELLKNLLGRVSVYAETKSG